MTKTTKIQVRHTRDEFLQYMPDVMSRLVNHACGFDVKEDGTRGEYNGELDTDILMQLTVKALPMMSLEDDQIKNYLEDPDTIKRTKTIEDLMEMRAEGLISDKQLKQYTEIMKTNYEITELDHLLQKLDELEEKKP